MAKNGQKTGGRKSGVPNRKTLEFMSSLGDYSPLAELIKLVKRPG